MKIRTLVLTLMGLLLSSFSAANAIAFDLNDSVKMPWITPIAFGACQAVQNFQQAEQRVGGRITVEAAIIHVVNCSGGQFYIYQYLNRQGFRVIRPGQWGNAIGGRDFQSFGEALNVAAAASGTTPAPQPPQQPAQTGPINCHKYCMDNSGYSPAEYMPCTKIPAGVTGTEQQCQAVAAQAKGGNAPPAGITSVCTSSCRKSNTSRTCPTNTHCTCYCDSNGDGYCGDCQRNQ